MPGLRAAAPWTAAQYMERMMKHLCAVAALSLTAARVGAADAAPLKSGISGAGKIGGTLAELWVKAGHEVLVSSRHPAELEGLARSLGPRARAGTPRDAAVFGDVVLVSVPYGALPQIGRDLAKELAGKVVLDTGNPYRRRCRRSSSPHASCASAWGCRRTDDRERLAGRAAGGRGFPALPDPERHDAQ